MSGDKSIELMQLTADKPIGLDDDHFVVDLSDEQTVCLRSLVHFASIGDVLGDAFKVSFITHSPDAESTVALQIVSIQAGPLHVTL